uniref:Uncharacterized protein n=1 Tax=Octactis speculum TaxID=3111310 RepID=A0A7S2CV08_9STRA
MASDMMLRLVGLKPQRQICFMLNDMEKCTNDDHKRHGQYGQDSYSNVLPFETKTSCQFGTLVLKGGTTTQTWKQNLSRIDSNQIRSPICLIGNFHAYEVIFGISSPNFFSRFK